MERMTRFVCEAVALKLLTPARPGLRRRRIRADAVRLIDEAQPPPNDAAGLATRCRGPLLRLGPVLPDVQRVEFGGLGHMGPVTHPDEVNAEIERFIDGRTMR